MSLTFSRVSAGLYEIQRNSNTVGFIRKVNASKWMVVDVADTPQHVSKTLKDAKYAAQNYIIFDNDAVVDKQAKDDYNHSVADEDNTVNKSLEIQREMLEKLYPNTVSSSYPEFDPATF